MVNLLDFFTYCAHTLKPLAEIKKYSKLWQCSACPALAAFQVIKSVLSHVVKLSHIDPGHELCLSVDTSCSRIGAIIQQLIDRNWNLTSFFSRKLSSAENCLRPVWAWTSSDLLCDTILSSTYRRPDIHILTDHNLLSDAFQSSPWNKTDELLATVHFWCLSPKIGEKYICRDNKLFIHLWVLPNLLIPYCLSFLLISRENHKTCENQSSFKWSRNLLQFQDK